MPLPALETELADIAVWSATIDDVERRRAGDAARLARYREIVACGDAQRLIETVLAGQHIPSPPRRIELNKAGPRKKVVYQLRAEDELLSRVLNRLLYVRVAPAISPRCHSFQRGRSAVTAFAALRSTPDVNGLASLHLDIADFFNSIEVEDLLRRLPAQITSEPVVMAFIAKLLRDTRVDSDGQQILVLRKGVMAGTPLAPMLTNLYLRDIDDAIAEIGVASARYSDDILVLGTPDQLGKTESCVRTLIAERGLRVNESKTRHGGSGEAWDFLGLRYSQGEIGLSANTMRKLRAKVRRRARREARYRLATASSTDETCRRFVAALNRKLYGTESAADADFGWARWFFPLLTSADQLADLDRYIQREVRWAACGSRRERARSTIPYEMLRNAGYRPLAGAYQRRRRGRAQLGHR
ncbi:MAG: reverse transcriptase domain-containing protein [Candidatus Dormiibacterota bacterium]